MSLQVLKINTKTDKDKENLFATEHLCKSELTIYMLMLSLIKNILKMTDQMIQKDSFLSQKCEQQLFMAHLIFFSIFHPIFNKSFDNCPLFKNEC